MTMAKKTKEPTVEELTAEIRRDFARWKEIRKKGAQDPTWGDGTNLNMVRRHIFIDQGRLQERCRAEGVKKCPIEARRKPPREYGENYMAPGQKRRKLPTMVELEKRKK